jgi:hypothetical protein
VKALASPTNSGTYFPYAGFATSAQLPTGFIPTAVVQGDFNEDGKMDMAISNGGDNSIYVLLGNGDGTFAVPEVLYTAGQSPVWLAAAKLRTSGHLDLIAVDGDSNQVEVFSGNGDGTFQPSSVIATLSQTPTFVLAGDFNSDGKIDLAVGLALDPYSLEPQFEILLGDGNGSFPSVVFPPPVDNTTSSDPLPTNWLAVGDINNDGQLDVVTTVKFWAAITYLNEGGTGFTQGAAFGPDDGTFQTPTTLMAHFGPVAVADLNHDGYLDLIQSRDADDDTTQDALTAAGGPFITSAITIYMGGPGGSFTKQATYFAQGI